MGFLRGIDKAWGGLLWLMMAAAAAYIGYIMLAIVYVTVFRAVGWPYTPFSIMAIEYGFVYILFLGSPWLVRTRGHVYIELLTAALPERPRIYVSRAIALLCAVICLIWAWYTWTLFVERWTDPFAFDALRAQHDIPQWIGTIPFPIGFLLMAIEFLRFVVVKEPMHIGIAGVASDRVELEEQKRVIEETR